MHKKTFSLTRLFCMITLTDCFQVANGKNGSRELVQATFLFAQLFHTFILTVQGQFVINELQDVYESMWVNEKY